MNRRVHLHGHSILFRGVEKPEKLERLIGIQFSHAIVNNTQLTQETRDWLIGSRLVLGEIIELDTLGEVTL